MKHWVRVAELMLVVLLALINVASAKTASYRLEVEEIVTLLQWWDQYGSAWDALDHDMILQHTLLSAAIEQVQPCHLAETTP